jgi:hypothetical protein
LLFVSCFYVLLFSRPGMWFRSAWGPLAHLTPNTAWRLQTRHMSSSTWRLWRGWVHVLWYAETASYSSGFFVWFGFSFGLVFRLVFCFCLFLVEFGF